MRKGDCVMTPHGKGEIVDKEEFKDVVRYGVKLENNPFPMPVAYYFKNELTAINGK